jgi:general secretion pathway protein G
VIFGQRNTMIGNAWLLLPFVASLFAVLLPQIISRYNKSKVNSTLVGMKRIEASIKCHKKEFGQYPDKISILKQNLSWKDSWNYPIEYVFKGPNEPPVIISYGSDGKTGGEEFRKDIVIEVGGVNPEETKGFR